MTRLEFYVESLGDKPKTRLPTKVAKVKLQIVLEATFENVWRVDQTVGQVQREATDKAVEALQEILLPSSLGFNEAHFKILDRGSAEIEVVVSK